jgi:glyoxylase-like metal-dependent hydrolase (beta-lactamase superfamily II)
MALAAGVAGSSLPFRAFAQAAPPPIRATKLSDRITMLYGDGGNVAIITSSDGLMMVDGGLPNRSADLLKAVSEQVDAHTIRIVFNTHWHFDHIGCNEALGRAGAKIIAQENVKKRLSVKTTTEALNRTFDPLQPEGIPSQTFTKGGKMSFGKEKIEYVHVAPAHTDGDTYVFFPGANILHTGDLMFNGFYPVIDYSTGGWIGGMAAASDLLLKVGDNKTQIIPGHGPMATKEDLKQTRDMLATVHDRLEKLIKEGKSLEESLAAAPTKDLDATWGKGSMKPEVFTRVAYTSIRQHHQKRKTR